MRMGILGTGFGKRHAELFSSFPDVDVVGIVGRDKGKTGQMAGDLGIAGFTDPQPLLDDPTIDLIDVCYPTRFHAEAVIAALQQGKHVFCETPVAFTLEEAEQMRRLAHSSKKLVLVGLFDRFQSEYKHVYESLHAGDFGQPLVVMATRRTPAIWGNLAENIILNLMIHDIDYLCWLVGTPLAVTARGLPNPQAGWDQVFVSLEFDGMNAMIEGCGIMPASFPFSTSLHVVCDQSAVDVNWSFGGEYPISTVVVYPSSGQPETLTIPGYDPYEAECRYVADCVHGNADPAIISIDAACESLRVAVAAQMSLDQHGRRIALEESRCAS